MTAGTATTPRPYRRPRKPTVEGVSHSRLARWASAQLLRPGLEFPGRPHGRGNRYVWPAEELRVAQDMGRLTAVGMTPSAAAAMARGGAERVEAFLATVTGGGDR